MHGPFPLQGRTRLLLKSLCARGIATRHDLRARTLGPGGGFWKSPLRRRLSEAPAGGVRAPGTRRWGRTGLGAALLLRAAEARPPVRLSRFPAERQGPSDRWWKSLTHLPARGRACAENVPRFKHRVLHSALTSRRLPPRRSSRRVKGARSVAGVPRGACVMSLTRHFEPQFCKPSRQTADKLSLSGGFLLLFGTLLGAFTVTVTAFARRPACAVEAEKTSVPGLLSAIRLSFPVVPTSLRIPYQDPRCSPARPACPVPSSACHS